MNNLSPNLSSTENTAALDRSEYDRHLNFTRDYLRKHLSISCSIDTLEGQLIEPEGINTLIYAKVPTNLGEYDYYRYINHHGLRNPIVDWRDANLLRTKLLFDKSPADARTQGDTAWGSRGVTIREGNRNLRPFSPIDIYELLVYEQELCAVNCPEPPLMNFWGECVLPAIANIPQKDPLSWAKGCMEIAVGYSTSLVSRHLPATFLADVVAPVAQKICNAGPKHEIIHHYHLTTTELQLLRGLAAAVSPKVRAEWCVLAIEVFKSVLTDPLVQKPLESIAKSLETGLDNGLRINRFIELGRWLNTEGFAPARIAQTLTTVINATFGSSVRDDEWWFKENDLLIPRSLADSRFGERELCYMERLAKASTKCFKASFDLAAQEKFALYQTNGISVDQATRIYSELARDYGVGNTARAQRVLGFLYQAIDRVSSTEISPTIERFLAFAHRQRPFSPLFGLMEGAEATLELPGLSAMLFKHAQAREFQGDDNTLMPKHILELERIVAQPLSERGHAEPPISPGIYRTPLLTLQGSLPLALPAPAKGTQNISPTNTQSTITQYLNLIEQVRNDCPKNSDRIIDIYFAICASKMPSPFSPPVGFIRDLASFIDLRNPEVENQFFHHPSERGMIVRQNTGHRNDRLLILSDLLDGVVVGAISIDRVSDLLRWTFEDISFEQRIEIEKARTWDAKEAAMSYWNHHFSNLASVDAELRGEIDELFDDHRHSNSLQMSERSAQRLAQLKARCNDLNEELASQLFGEYRDQCEYTIPDRNKIDEIQLQRDVESRMRGATEEQQLKRFMGLQYYSDLIGSCYPFIASGIVTAEKIREVLEASWKFISSGADIKAREFSLHSDGYIFRGEGFGDFATLLRNANERGVLKDESVRTAFELTSSLSGKSYSEFLSKLFLELQTASSFHNTSVPNIKTTCAQQLIQQDYSYEKLEELVQRESYSFFGDTIGQYDYVKLTPYIKEIVNDLWVKERGFLAAFKEIRRSRNQMQSSTDAGPAQIAFGLSLAVGRSLIGEIRGQQNEESLHRSLPAIRLSESCVIQTPDIEDIIRRCREASFGLLPVGGKVHMLHAFDASRTTILEEIFPSKSSFFRLQHANTTLLLPPLPSAGEMELLCSFLVRHHVVNTEWPEIQQTIPGRSPAELCAYLGASVLLGTTVGVRYNESSFKTSHDRQVQFKIMTYDAGGVRLDLPFCPNRPGRTDMLGRRSAGDFEIYQRVGSVLNSEVDHGPFADIGLWYREEFKRILTEYGLGDVLKASWIAEKEQHWDDTSGAEHFSRAISPCIEAYFGCVEHYHETSNSEGIVFDVRRLQAELASRVREVQTQMLNDPRYEPERKLIFSS